MRGTPDVGCLYIAGMGLDRPPAPGSVLVTQHIILSSVTHLPLLLFNCYASLQACKLARRTGKHYSFASTCIGLHSGR